MTERYLVRETLPDFGIPPYLYLDIDGKRGPISPHLGLQAGDSVIIERKKNLENSSDLIIDTL